METTSGIETYGLVFKLSRQEGEGVRYLCFCESLIISRPNLQDHVKVCPSVRDTSNLIKKQSDNRLQSCQKGPTDTTTSSPSPRKIQSPRPSLQTQPIEIVRTVKHADPENGIMTEKTTRRTVVCDDNPKDELEVPSIS